MQLVDGMRGHLREPGVRGNHPSDELLGNVAVRVRRDVKLRGE